MTPEAGPRSPCGCSDRDDYADHPDEPCDWSPWHVNQYFPLREDRFCWKCGGMESQTLERGISRKVNGEELP